MLGAILWSFVGALICTMIISGIGFVRNKKTRSDYSTRIKWAIVIFGAVFVALLLIFYVWRQPQTILTVLQCIWAPLGVVAFVYLYNNCYNKVYETEFIVACIVAAISGVVCFAGLFVPDQNLIYVHDMENVDVTYAVSSDEMLAKLELRIDNSQFRKKYYFESPEMRQVDGKDVAVYHIGDNTGGSTEYIPGYAIQEENELPQIISKRIYFDTSYCNKRDALRTIRRKYPTVILGNHKFDIDDDWNPYEVYEYRENLFFTNGKDYGIIILNLVDGTCQKYPAVEDKTPSWVDFKTTYPR